MPTLHIRLQGGFRLVYDETLLTSVGSPRLQSLLANLILHRDTPQSRRRPVRGNHNDAYLDFWSL